MLQENDKTKIQIPEENPVAPRFPGGLGGEHDTPTTAAQAQPGHWGPAEPGRQRLPGLACHSLLNCFLGLFCLKSGGKNKLLHIHKFKLK